MLIAFEGIDGCGKTTVVNAVAAHLRQQRFDPLVTSELARQHHPDRGGDLVMAARINAAWAYAEEALS